MFAYIGALMVLVQGLLVRRMVPRFGERRLILIGTALMGCGFLMQWWVSSLVGLFLAIAVTAIGNGLNNPSLSSLISRAASGEDQGGVLGVSQSAGALARVVGPLVGLALLHEHVGRPYLVGGCIMLAASLFAFAVVRQPQAR
jgi:MFS family permease